MIGGFNDLVRQYEPDTQKETVILAIFYLENVEDSAGGASREDIYDLIKSAKVSIPRRNISAYLNQMKGDEIVNQGDDVFALSISKERGFQESTDISEIKNGRQENFVNFSDTTEDFYQNLLEDINRSHKQGLDDATLILSRKLLENLVLDILRLRYGLDSENRELFYNTQKGHLLSFSQLLENFQQNLEDIEYFSDRLDEELIREIDDLKGRGDASAHSIEVNVSEEVIQDYKNRLNPVVDVLFYVKKQIEKAEQEQT
jgi:hypothetical protein